MEPENKIFELFGCLCSRDDIDFIQLCNDQFCPFSGLKCYKGRKSQPDVKIGVCSIIHQGMPIVICPNRFLENKQVFKNCIAELKGVSGHGEIKLVKEFQIKEGMIDGVLVYYENENAMDFLGIELQALDTSGSSWPFRQRFLRNRGLDVSEDDLIVRKPLAINWKMTLKTTLVQIFHKANAFRRLGKTLVLIVQEALLCRMEKDFDLPSDPSFQESDVLHIHSYDYVADGCGAKLNFVRKISLNYDQLLRCLDLRNRDGMSVDAMLRALTQKRKTSINIT